MSSYFVLVDGQNHRFIYHNNKCSNRTLCLQITNKSEDETLCSFNKAKVNAAQKKFENKNNVSNAEAKAAQVNDIKPFDGNQNKPFKPHKQNCKKICYFEDYSAESYNSKRFTYLKRELNNQEGFQITCLDCNQLFRRSSNHLNNVLCSFNKTKDSSSKITTESYHQCQTLYQESQRNECHQGTQYHMDKGKILHDLLLLTQNTLTANLASISNILIENFNYYTTTAFDTKTSLGHMEHHHHHYQGRNHDKNCENLTKCQQQHCDHHHYQRKYSVNSNVIPTSYGCNSSASGTCNYMGHNYYHLLRNPISFYAASSVLLVLCYLSTTISAAVTNTDTAQLEKHPIQSIDWSKFDESSSDKEILDLLLEKKRYDKRLLPPVNDEDFCCGLSSPDMANSQNARRLHNRGTLTVNVNVLLLSLASPDESSLKYEVEFLLNQQWNDPRLQYGNKSHYDFLNALHHHDSIWTPDTYFIMHGDFKDPIIPMHFALRIYRNGTITYAMRRHLILSCQGSLHIFPFDDPKCSFSMESISYEEAQIKYVWKNDEDTLRKSPSLTTLNAYLIKNQTTACDQNSWRGNYSCLRVDLIFTRDRAFYFTTVFIPGIILVTSSFITFWLEWNAVPARSMIGVTTMLNFFTTSNGFRSTLPVVSNLTAMNVWDGVCMCFIYASLLEFVCVNYVGRKRPLHNVVYRPGENPVTQRLPAVLSRIGVILASPLAAAGSSSTGTSIGITSPDSRTPKISSTRIRWEEQRGGIIGAAVQNLRSRSIKCQTHANVKEIAKQQVQQPIGTIYNEQVFLESNTAMSVETATVSKLRRTLSVSTNTPPIVTHGHMQKTSIPKDKKREDNNEKSMQINIDEAERQLPLKPPRKKSSRSTSPTSTIETITSANNNYNNGDSKRNTETSNIGEKKREAGAPNEIVTCTTCGGNNTPCTHSANNGCATETCFVQVRKKEPPHPIRVAKTIDVIARITFPTAYAIFLIFFFVHYKGFS